MSAIPMMEYLLWSNCSNNCKFCWQKRLKNEATWLTDEEKIDSINQCKQAIDQLGYTDILVVGGEVYGPHTQEVDTALRSLFDKIAQRVKQDQTRFFYVNTNLIYEDLSNLDYLINAFEGVVDRIKFTTSADAYGRFEEGFGAYGAETEEVVARNLRYLADTYPELNIVVNTIMTKQFHRQFVDDPVLKDAALRPSTFKGEFGIKHMNLLPYIPIPGDTELVPTFGQIVACLEEAESEVPGYISFYVADYDLNQNKILYQYERGKGFVECTAQYLPCGHNKNFSKVLPSGECYVCKIKQYAIENGKYHE